MIRDNGKVISETVLVIYGVENELAMMQGLSNKKRAGPGPAEVQKGHCGEVEADPSAGRPERCGASSEDIRHGVPGEIPCGGCRA